jgi:alanine-glyoxylate transaminase/serine-glyoxylate transaminase/serine-pyruvate transaminase
MKNRNLLMIPGPVEFDPAVLRAVGSPTTSHVAPNFIDIFGACLEQMRQVFLCPDGQPFILAGSGTLAMDFVGSNLTEPGDPALVLQTGYFSDRFDQILQHYGADTRLLPAPVGGRSSLEEVETALKARAYKMIVITHVDTSTGVAADIRGAAALARRYGALCVVDGVCSVAGEELRMTEWGVDAVLTASQKAIGVPPGLALAVLGPAAMTALRARKTPPASYYTNWNHWLPVMEAYEARKPAYFATPAVNLVAALHVGLEQILKEGLAARFERHRAISRACKAGLAALGLGQVPFSADISAVTLSAPRFPKGIAGPEFLGHVNRAGVILAGGLHPAIRSEYFRIGHMGAVTIGDVMAVLSAVEHALAACGIKTEPGSGLAAAQRAYWA